MIVERKFDYIDSKETSFSTFFSETGSKEFLDFKKKNDWYDF